MVMAKVSTKRQITLPIEQCLLAQIQHGDSVQSYVDRHGVISIVKKQPGAAKGLLRNVKIETQVSDQESLESALNR